MAAAEGRSRLRPGVFACGAGEGVRVEAALPAGDGEHGNGVADDVGQGRGGGHDAIDTEQQAQTAQRQDVHRLQGGRQLDEGAASHRGAALGGDAQDRQQTQLLPEREGGVGGLSDEADGDGHVDGSAVQIEAVTGRQHEAHYHLVTAAALEFLDQAREGHLAGGVPNTSSISSRIRRNTAMNGRPIDQLMLPSTPKTKNSEAA